METNEEPFSIELTPGVDTTINNPNPMTWEVRIETMAGSVIGFSVPCGGSFSIKPNEPFRKVSIDCGGGLKPFGPRLVDQ